VKVNKEGDSRNTIGFDQSEAKDLLCCSRKIQAGRIILRGQRKELTKYSPATIRAGSPQGRAVAVLCNSVVSEGRMGMLSILPGPDMEQRVMANMDDGIILEIGLCKELRLEKV
jgi:hypothetical protein